MIPSYRLTVESTTFSTEDNNLISQIGITDKIGNVADTLDFSIAYDGSYEIPKTKGKCTVEIGYTGVLPVGVTDGLWEVGTFIIENVSLSVSKSAGNAIAVRAISMPESPETAKSLQNSHTRQWQSYELKETTFATIVDEVCRGAGLSAEIDKEIAGIEMPFTAQVGETDAEFLTMLSAGRNARVKYNNQTVVIVRKDAATLPTVDISADSHISDYTHSVSTRSDIKQVDATYRDSENAVKVVKAGSGEPKLVIKRLFPSETAATDAAKSLLAHIQRDTEQLNMTLPTHPNLRAESPLNLSGFEGNTDGLYICYEVQHTLDSSGLMSTAAAKKRVQV